MKPLDIVKILMGIYSDRPNVKRFINNGRVWAKLQEYDYEDVFKVATATVNQFYLDIISGGSNQSDKNLPKDFLDNGEATKKRKLN